MCYNKTGKEVRTLPKKQTAWTRAYNEKAYERLEITIPKGQKDAVKAHAKAKGESVNGFVNRLIRTDMNLTDEEWKQDTPE